MKKNIRAMVIIDNAGTKQAFVQEFTQLSVANVKYMSARLRTSGATQEVSDPVEKLLAEFNEAGSVASLETVHMQLEAERAKADKTVGDWVLTLKDSVPEIEFIRRDHWNEQLYEMNFSGESIRVLKSAPLQ
ncbi:hypothetical protein [Hydrogenophaga sp.]|uniref:hypothetical protein n=1 Tax=Hydrogenophaga sp. TaxID=1904254 RepID=UPI002FCA4261